MMLRRARRILASGLLPIFLVACSEDADPGGGSPDASEVSADALGSIDATSYPDAAAGPVDAGEPDALPRDSEPARTGFDPAVETLDVGSVTLVAGRSAPVAFEMPADVASFMVVIAGPDTAMFVPLRLDGPSGELVSDDATGISQIEMFFLGPFAAQFKSPNRVVQDLGISASLFPGNPGVSVTGGMYSLVVGGLVPQGNQGSPYTGDVSVSVHYRRAAPAAGRIDLHLYFTGGGGIDVDTAPSSPLIQNALTRLGEIWAQANVEIGSTFYHAADEAYRSLAAPTGAKGGLEELFQGSAGQGAGMHFFFIDRFESAFGGVTIAGVSGGLPGAPGRTGSVGAGVAVAITAANGDANILAHVMAHEGAHWLGLFHTAEIFGAEDQFPDTPPGQGGTTHLMYPAVGGGTMISPAQGVVLRQHPEVVSR